jgi:hypothetical protein
MEMQSVSQVEPNQLGAGVRRWVDGSVTRTLAGPRRAQEQHHKGGQAEAPMAGYHCFVFVESVVLFL